MPVSTTWLLLIICLIIIALLAIVLAILNCFGILSCFCKSQNNNRTSNILALMTALVFFVMYAFMF